MSSFLSWRACEGRNTWDHPIAVPDDMGTEALNVSLNAGQLGIKRPGSAVVTISGDTFSGIRYLGKFLATGDDSTAQLMIVSADATTKVLRVTSAATAVNLTLAHAFSSTAIITSATLNGKWFLAYQNGTNRLQVYDPGTSTSLIRSVGLALPAAATCANTGGGGTIAHVQRWYQVQWRVKSGSTILRQSNLGPSVAFTPGGAADAVRVTRPTAPSEGETHWALFASSDSTDGPFYEIAETAIATTTYDDSNVNAIYNTFPPGPLVGESFPFPSVKSVVSDGTRLLGLGVWETSAGDSVAPIAGRVYFTPPLGTSDRGDDERCQNTVNQSDWIDLAINASAVDVGLAGPINNNIFAFQSRGIYMLSPTGSAETPYRRVVISKQHGAVSAQSLVTAEDEAGAPCLYFLDPQDGPRRIQLGAGVQWLGKDVKDLWDTVNLAATKPAFGVYDAVNKQVKWWIATNGADYPNAMIVFHVALGRVESYDLRRGWAQWQGPLTMAAHACMFPATLAASRPYLNVPYVGQSRMATCADHSVHVTTLPIEGATTGVAGAIGGGTKGISLQNGTAWFTANLSLPSTGTNTLEAWINAHAQGGDGFGTLWIDNGVFGNGFYIKDPHGASWKIAYYHNNVEVATSTSSLTLGTTYHVAITLNGTVGTFYINGAADGTFTYSGITLDQMFNNDAGEACYANLIDEMAIYPSCLTGPQVLANYNNGIAGVPATYRAAVLALTPTVYYEFETADFTNTPLARQDGTSNYDYGTVKYQAYVRSKAWDLEPLARRKRITEAYLGALAGSATIAQLLIKDWGTANSSETVSIAASGNETRVRPRLSSTDMANAITIQTQLGDERADSQTWTLDFWQGVYEDQRGAK